MEELRKIIILEFKWSLFRNTNEVSSKLEYELVSVQSPDYTEINPNDEKKMRRRSPILGKL